MQKFRQGYRVWWRAGGRRKSRCFSTRSEAERFEAEMKLGIVPTDGQNSQNPIFKDFAERWLVEYSATEKARQSYDEDKRIVSRHLVPAIGEKPIRGLKKSDLIELKAKLLQTQAHQKQKALKPKTVNNVLMVAKKIMSHALDLGLVSENPWRGVKPLKIGDQPFDFWTAEERDEFYQRSAQLSPDIADCAFLACHTGLRRGELAALTWNAVDLKRKKIRVGQSYSVRLGEFGPTKGKEISEVPLNEAALCVLERRHTRREGTTVFPVHMFGNLRRDFLVLCKRVGVRPIRFHDTRHTFASTLAMAGADIKIIQELMRHKSYQMTLRYAHLHPSQKAVGSTPKSNRVVYTLELNLPTHNIGTFSMILPTILSTLVLLGCSTTTKPQTPEQELQSQIDSLKLSLIATEAKVDDLSSRLEFAEISAAEAKKEVTKLKQKNKRGKR